MKLAPFLLPFALLLGLVIGGWAPKEELRAAQRRAADLEARLAEADKGSRLDAFTRMIKIPERAQRPASERPASAGPAAAAPAAGEPAAPAARPAALPAEAATNAAPATTAGTPDGAQPAPEDLRARIDEAKELWKARVDVARAQWTDRLRLSPEEAARFDDALNTMNENLYHAMQGLADGLAGEEALTPEAGVRAFNAMTESLVTAYDDLATAVPEARRAEAAKMELTDFIDPGVAEPLVAVQDKLDKLPRDRGPRLRFRR